MEQETLDDLLDVVKKHLKVTSNREDDTIKEYIQSAASEMTGWAGPYIDFKDDYASRQLLKDYCRYAYNGSLEYFEENFSRAIIRLQLKEAAKAFKRSD